jgi:2-dehydro-3-deoxy-D-gluconate 5-dehydrogenase
MADQKSVQALTPAILADGHEVRILVTCAGIQRRHPCEEFPDSDFNEVPADGPPRLLEGGLLTLSR